MEVSADVLHKEFCFFWLEVPDNSRTLVVKVTPKNRYSELSLYVSNTAVCPSKADFSWRAVGAGELTLEVQPGDQQYQTGKYCIGVYGSWQGMNSFSLTAEFIAVRQIVQLQHSWDSVVTDHDHYSWKVKSPGRSRLLIEVSVGSVAVFISSVVRYPDEHKHCYSRGCTDDSQLANVLDPYPAAFRQAYSLKLNSPYYSPPTSRDNVKLCISTDDWTYGSSDCYITVKNLSPSPVAYSIQVSELDEEMALEASRVETYRTFKVLFETVDGASASYYERQRLNLLGDIQLTYGEVEFVYAVQLLDLVKPAASEVFVDLGCGTGKCVVTAALVYPQLAEARGIELLKPLYESCRDTLQSLPAGAAATRVVEGDISEVEWTDADIVYTASVCFSQSLLDYIAHTADQLKQGSRVVSLKALNMSSKFNEQAAVSVKMTWGYSEAFVYVKQDL
jgi:precorrin-6B methylase 2